LTREKGKALALKRLKLRHGLTRRQRHFVLEKLFGLNDKDAALSAGYSLSVAENTKQRIWKPTVTRAFLQFVSELASVRQVAAMNFATNTRAQSNDTAEAGKLNG